MSKSFIGCFPGIGESAMLQLCSNRYSFFYSLKSCNTSSKALLPIIYTDARKLHLP